MGEKISAIVRGIEKQNLQLARVLPEAYNRSMSTLVSELLKKVYEIPASTEYDALGASMNTSWANSFAAEFAGLTVGTNVVVESWFHTGRNTTNGHKFPKAVTGRIAN